MDALRISPKYTSVDWEALDSNRPEDWAIATAMVKDRLEGRFLHFATELLRTSEHSGFAVLALDCLLAETLQQFNNGITDGHGRSEELVTRFLEGKRFQPGFDAPARRAFYRDIRCGLLHQAEAKRMWLIRRRQRVMLQAVPGGEGYILDIERFHAGAKASLGDYLMELAEPANTSLRSNLWKKMDVICSVRAARGAVYEAAATSGEDM